MILLRNVVVLLAQLFIIWAIYMISEYIVDFFHLPVPASVLGMVILFIGLSTKIIKLQYIEKVASILNKHLAFFFLPYAVGLMGYGGLIKSSGLELLVMIIASTSIGLLITSVLSQYLTNKELAKHEQSDSL